MARLGQARPDGGAIPLDAQLAERPGSMVEVRQDPLRLAPHLVPADQVSGRDGVGEAVGRRGVEQVVRGVERDQLAM